MFLNFLRGPLAIHDDQAAIVRQEENYRRWSWRQVLTQTQRPMVELLNTWTYRRWGFSPPVWHMQNCMLHFIAIFILFGLLNRLGISHPLWLTAAFALHPLQTHSWAYVTGRSGILSAIFLFTAALVYLGKLPVLATIPALLAVAAREDSIIFLVWLPVLEWFR